MSSSVLHHCPFCGYETEVANSFAAFAENPHCRQCGLSASEGANKMQDDLAALFARQMTVAGAPPPGSFKKATPPTPDLFPSPPRDTAPPIVYSITQHYHHSSHLAMAGTGVDRSGVAHDLRNEPSISAEEMLLRHNVNPSSLFPSQLTLFQQADLEQKARLIELWQISPPNGGNPISQQAVEIPSSQAGALSSDIQSGVRNSVSQPYGVDNMDQDNMTGIDAGNAEPYVMSGYESLAQREYEVSAKMTADAPISTSVSYNHATDPAYKGPDWPEQSIPMEHQYGAFEQRNMYFGCGVRTPHWFGNQDMF